eukprot:TRINITY_DN9752_c0_g1_i1.p3 TRINITY_DN9752_c0_g1~~TRINITY_DN9752_c0_g1_i1.p3  ORF type:complete len:368 (+),score=93.81 TRINITY_DN9752_c0_g1_i1:70-1173(+)
MQRLGVPLPLEMLHAPPVRAAYLASTQNHGDVLHFFQTNDGCAPGELRPDAVECKRVFAVADPAGCDGDIDDGVARCLAFSQIREVVLPAAEAWALFGPLTPFDQLLQASSTLDFIRVVGALYSRLPRQGRQMALLRAEEIVGEGVARCSMLPDQGWEPPPPAPAPRPAPPLALPRVPPPAHCGAVSPPRPGPRCAAARPPPCTAGAPAPPPCPAPGTPSAAEVQRRFAELGRQIEAAAKAQEAAEGALRAEVLRVCAREGPHRLRSDVDRHLCGPPARPPSDPSCATALEQLSAASTAGPPPQGGPAEQPQDGSGGRGGGGADGDGEPGRPQRELLSPGPLRPLPATGAHCPPRGWPPEAYLSPAR